MTRAEEFVLKFEYQIALFFFVLSAAITIVAFFTSSAAQIPRNPELNTMTPYGIAVIIGALASLLGGMSSSANRLSYVYGELIRFTGFGIAAGMMCYAIAELFMMISITQWVIFTVVSGAGFVVGFVLARSAIEEADADTKE